MFKALIKWSCQSQWDGQPHTTGAMRSKLEFWAEFSVFCNRIPWEVEELACISLVLASCIFFVAHFLALPPSGSGVVCFSSPLKPKTIFWHACDFGTVQLLKEKVVCLEEMPNQHPSYVLWNVLKATVQTQVAVLFSDCFLFVCLFVCSYHGMRGAGYICCSWAFG